MGNSATIVTEMLMKSACGHAIPVICLQWEYIDMGLQLEGHSGFPALGIGITLANFQSEGNKPDFKHSLNN